MATDTAFTYMITVAPGATGVEIYYNNTSTSSYSRTGTSQYTYGVGCKGTSPSGYRPTAVINGVEFDGPSGSLSVYHHDISISVGLVADSSVKSQTRFSYTATSSPQLNNSRCRIVYDNDTILTVNGANFSQEHKVLKCANKKMLSDIDVIFETTS